MQTVQVDNTLTLQQTNAYPATVNARLALEVQTLSACHAFFLVIIRQLLLSALALAMQDSIKHRLRLLFAQAAIHLA